MPTKATRPWEARRALRFPGSGHRARAAPPRGVILVGCPRDAEVLRSRGVRGEIVVVPPAAAGSIDSTTPIRPPRVLCVGSETVANLDGVRWFRKNVYPAILQLAPTCRLRLVGEMARHVDPAPGVDRIGWVDNLDEEYANAALVALPCGWGRGSTDGPLRPWHTEGCFARRPSAPAGPESSSSPCHCLFRPGVLAAEARSVLTSDSCARATSEERSSLRGNRFPRMAPRAFSSRGSGPREMASGPQPEKLPHLLVINRASLGEKRFNRYSLITLMDS